jgi:hypothetical protein
MPRNTNAIWCCAWLLAGIAGCAWCGRAPESGEARAGYPSEVNCCAQPSDDGHYVGYEVGGGSACPGDGPTVYDGTWGWDYSGLWLPARVVLDWFHGTQYQGGTGAYQVDGPRPAEEIERRHEE